MHEYVIDESLRSNPLHVLLDRRTRHDPYPVLAELRAVSPLRTGDGSLVVGDYENCLAVLRNPAMGSDTLASAGLRGVLPGERQELLDSIFFMDPPDHGRQRRLISKAFTPRITDRFRPWIQGIIDELIDGFRHNGEFDAVDDFAKPMSMRMIGELMNVPSADLDMLREWSDQLALAAEFPALVAGFRSTAMFHPEDFARTDRTGTAMHAYFADLIHKRRRDPGEDLLSSLLSTRDRGESLARHEVTNVLVTLFAAAHESVTNLISNGILALHRHSDQLAAYRADPSTGRLLVEEVLRYDAPVQLTARVAVSPTVVGGLDVEPGTIVILLLAAANRDSARYPAADEFIADRRTRTMQLAFGAGPHFCIGAAMARLQAELALRAVAERFAEFEVDEESLAYRRHVVVRGLSSMSVRFHL